MPQEKRNAMQPTCNSGKRRKISALRGPPWTITTAKDPEDIPCVRTRMLDEALAGDEGKDLCVLKSAQGVVLARFHATVAESAGVSFGESVHESRAPDYLVSQRDAHAFLTFMYLGALTSKCVGADGRVLWLLARDYQVRGLAETLVKNVDKANFCGVFQFIVQTDHGDLKADAKKVQSACLDHAIDLNTYTWDTKDMPGGAFAALLQGVLRRACHPRGRNMLHAFNEASRWLRHKYGAGNIPDNVRSAIMGLFDWTLMPRHAFLTHVKPSNLLTETEFFAAVMQFFALAPSLDPGFPEAFSLELRSGADPERAVAVLPGDDHVKVAIVDDHEKVILYKISLSSMDTTSKAEIRLLCNGSNYFGKAEAVAIDPSSGGIFVSDCHKRCIFVFDHGGGYKCCIRDAKRIVSPHGIAFNASGNLYVVETERGCVLELTRDGAFVREFVPHGKAVSPNRPYWIAVSSEGDVAVTDYRSALFRVYDAKGTLVHTEDCAQSGGECIHAESIAFAPDGSILVTTKRLDCILVFGKCQGYRLTRRAKCDGAHGIAVLDDQVVVTTRDKLAICRYTR